MKETIGIELLLEDGGFSANIRRADDSLQKITRSFSNTVTAAQRAETGIARAARSFRQVSVTIAALRYTVGDIADVFVRLPSSIMNVANKFERLQVMLEGLSKKSSAADRTREAADNIKYLVDMAKNAPFNIESLSDAFVKLRVGGVDPLNGSLQALVDANARFGGSSDTLKRAAVAIQQMGGKGVISMEELRQQLGEAIPDAIHNMAVGVGASIPKLTKAISQGSVRSQEALSRMFTVMRFENEGAAERMMKTWGGMTSRMKTNWDLLVNDLAKSKFGDEVKKQVGDITDFLGSNEGKRFAKDLGEAMASLTTILSTTAKLLVDNIGLVKALGAAFAATKTMTFLGSGLKSLRSGAMLAGTIVGGARSAVLGDVENSRQRQKRIADIQNKSIRDYVAFKTSEERQRRAFALKAARDRQIETAKELSDNKTKLNALLAQYTENNRQIAVAKAALNASASTTAIIPLASRAEMRRQARQATESQFRMNPVSAAVSGVFAGAGMSAAQIAGTEKASAALGRQIDATKRLNVALMDNQGKALLNVRTQEKLAKASGWATTKFAAQATAMKAGGAVLSLMGGWVGVISAALIAGVWAWDKWGNAAKKAREEALQTLESGLATSQTVAQFVAEATEAQKELDEALALVAKNKAEKPRQLGGGYSLSQDDIDKSVSGAEKRVVEAQKKLKQARDNIAKGRKQAVDNDATNVLAEQSRSISQNLSDVSEKYRVKIIKNAADQEEKIKQIKLKGAKDASAQIEKISAERTKFDRQQILAADQEHLGYLQAQSVEIDEQLRLARQKNASQEDLNKLIAQSRSLHEKVVDQQGKVDGSTMLQSDMDLTGGKPKKKASKTDAQRLEDKIQGILDRARNLREQFDESGDNLFGALLDPAKANLAGTNLASITQQVLRLNQAMENKGGGEGGLARLANEVKGLKSDAALRDLTDMALKMRDSTREIRIGLIGNSRAQAQAEYNYEMEVVSAKYAALMDEVRGRDDASEKIKQIEADKAQYILARTAQLQKDMRAPIQQMADDWRDNFVETTSNTMVSWANQSIDAIAEVTETGTFAWREMTVSWLKDLNRMVLQKTLATPFEGMFSSMGDGIKSLLSSIGIGGSGAAAGAGAVTEGLVSTANASNLASQAMETLAQSGADEATKAFAKNAIQTALNTATQGSASSTTVTSMLTVAGAAQLAAQALLQLAASQGGSETGGIIASALKMAGGALLGGGGAASGSDVSGDYLNGTIDVPTDYMATSDFANGGIMTRFGAVPLRKYANGGIANAPQLALYGEGKKPEAYVPLPDGRTIPVTMDGAGGDVTPVNITINVTQNSNGSESKTTTGDVESMWRGAADKMRAIALDEIVKQKRAGGVLGR
ncbi:tape measure protein [Castellaniella sp.]|uniref:tape measure protein n=1 Tax=Castellaniella sp. TaxID=1955812 RepID=UPI002AFFE8D5|nr:tape measure protein [Castellaniella sp.]